MLSPKDRSEPVSCFPSLFPLNNYVNLVDCTEIVEIDKGANSVEVHDFVEAGFSKGRLFGKSLLGLHGLEEQKAHHARAAAAAAVQLGSAWSWVLGFGSWVSKVLNEIRESLEEEVSELNFPRSPRNSRPRAATVAGSGSSPFL
ncbi:hypothetical protein F2Q69_00052751 [Brassica cretica]|uniref:Uncharacterized protein n=1 Tax=Brassica cretica TaxID=69181 RepID=A0A8S9MZS3_BRACR|nr:hypothetical protein F2Q69_00052751 [Brassica cretica]